VVELFKQFRQTDYLGIDRDFNRSSVHHRDNHDYQMDRWLVLRGRQYWLEHSKKIFALFAIGILLYRGIIYLAAIWQHKGYEKIF